MADPMDQATSAWFDTMRKLEIPTQQWPQHVDQFYNMRDGKPINVPDHVRKAFEDYNKQHGAALDLILKNNGQPQTVPPVTNPEPAMPREVAQPQQAPAAVESPKIEAPAQPEIVNAAPPIPPATANPQGAQNGDWWSKHKVVQQNAAGGDWWSGHKVVNEAEKPLPWADVPGQALQNAPASALNFGKALVHPIIHPIDTIQTIGQLAGGLMSKAYTGLGGKVSPEAKAEMEKTTNAVGAYLANRYGTVEGFKKAIATDPVGVLADVSLVMTGGGSAAARAPGLIGQAGQKVATAGRAIDPLANAGRVVSKAGPMLAETLGVTTGAGARPFKEAYAAGQTGNQAFVDNMRANRPATDVIDMAENAVGQMGRDRSNAYTANMAAVKANPTPVNMTPIRDAITTALNTTHYKGIVKDAEAQRIVQLIANKYNDFLTLPPVERTAEALDALKQSLGEIRQTTQQGTLARKVADGVYNSAKSEIVKQVPEYATAMKDYANASDNIAEMRRTMSISDKAMPDTTMRKLQSTMRNNVNTNYGQREKLLDTLARYEPNLPPALGGMSLNTWAPRGLARTTPGQVMAGGAAFMAPQALAVLPFTSPRVMGEAAYAAGRAGGATENALMRFGMTPDILAAIARGSYAANALTRTSDQ